MTYKEKMSQANREARSAVIGLVLTIIVWALLGFGVSTLDLEIFSTPLWVFTGTIGTFVFAVLITVVMAFRVFKDVDLDGVEPCQLDEENADADSMAASSERGVR